MQDFLNKCVWIVSKAPAEVKLKLSAGTCHAVTWSRVKHDTLRSWELQGAIGMKKISHKAELSSP